MINNKLKENYYMGKVTILKETTINPITTMGERAGVCWNADISNSAKNYQRGLDCLDSGHGRVLEFVNIEMILEGYSARVVREWYTHIGGAPTRLQASTRYINYSDFNYIIPHSINQNPEALQEYIRVMQTISDSCKTLIAKHEIPKEDAALLLPLGMQTTIVDKRNLRNLIDMSHQRMCKRANWEYRELFSDICTALASLSPEWNTLIQKYFIPKCQFLGYCPEKYSCKNK